ncbi:MAG: cobyrinate a,c-diamide synthase [Rhodospirillales bacterium]|nr:cobyrinate a,c-diamide synthase [Rhodospirillales bacterium]MDP6804528.1 cobyrinate a,c-diamide synthase [Rhodospirillales bacterium]
MTTAGPPGLIVAAPASASGKTVVTLGLIRHFVRTGARVAAAKAGPDYIDPRFHAAASGRPCYNLDSWAMRAATLMHVRDRLGADVDLVICEGVMGLFDGVGPGAGSTADLAASTGWPVILVVDVRGQGASAAALVRGFASHRSDVTLAGVVFNRTGSDRHAAILEAATVDAVPSVARLGCIPRMADLALPSRHLGLVQAGERADLDATLDRAAVAVARYLDIGAIRRIAGPGAAVADEGRWSPSVPPLGQRIAFADDAAFAFSYPLVLEAWRDAGAEVVPFSPLAGEGPDAGADAVYLPGGYPELYAGRIAGARDFLDGLADAAGRGAVVYGECGGYMVLGRCLIDEHGVAHAMAGLLALETSFAEPRLHLGYRRARVSADGPLGEAGVTYRAHEFHYARTLEEGPGAPLFECADAGGAERGPAGLVDGRVMGSFIHLIDREDA